MKHRADLAAKLYARHSDKNQAPSKATEIIELARRVHTGEVTFSEWSVFVHDQLKLSERYSVVRRDKRTTPR
jgi:hypothetical protein